MSSDIPVEILSTEEREDGVYVEGRMPGRKLTTDEMNEVLEREGLSVRLKPDSKFLEDPVAAILEAKRQAEENARKPRQEWNPDDFEPIPDSDDKDLPTFLKNGGQISSIFANYPKVETVRGPSRDRSLSGKARRKARRNH